jgi:hypothetical protein
MKLPGVISAEILSTLMSSTVSAAAACESLSSLSLPEATITVAQTGPGRAYAASPIL